jgi:hypothetical protein
MDSFERTFLLAELGIRRHWRNGYTGQIDIRRKNKSLVQVRQNTPQFTVIASGQILHKSI